MRETKTKINFILMFTWMAFIFIMSSFNSTDSSNQSNFIVDIISNILNIDNIEILSLIIRKLAHFTEYFILGLLTYNLIHSYNKKTYIAIIICIIYAISDEIHQIFVPGRSCQILDITIDSIGSILGIYILSYIKRKKFKHIGVRILFRTRNFTQRDIICITCERSCVLWEEQIKNMMKIIKKTLLNL